MAVRRSRAPRRARAPREAYGRTYKKWMSSEPDVVVQRSTTGSAGGGYLAAAAEQIAQRARELASWSRQIPPSISVQVSGNVATISSDAPPAYPNEIAGVRHPTFGHDPWVTNEYRPFLSAAADQRAGAAMAKYADKIDTMCRARGFR